MRFVADGNKAETPTLVTYSTVVSRDSVHICLTIAALNDLEVLAADVENAYWYGYVVGLSLATNKAGYL